MFHSNYSGKVSFLSRDQSDCKTFCKMADADGFVRGKTLDIFWSMLNENELDHLLEKEMDNIRCEAISYRYILFVLSSYCGLTDF